MRKRALLGLASVVCLAAYPGLSAYGKKNNADQSKLFSKEIPKNERIQQALNRLTFGPCPGDVQQVQSLGLKKWIDLQLHPNRIPQNPILKDKLQMLDTLRMSSEQLVINYPTPQTVREIVAGRMPYPTDPDRRMMIQKLVARYERKQGQDAGKQNAQAANVPVIPAVADLLSPQQIRILRTGNAEQRLSAFESLPAAKQDEVIEALPGGMRQRLFDVAPPELRRRIEMAGGPQQVVVRDLTEAKLFRAIYSNRQLDEVLTDFWFNHFNVYLDKGADRYLVTEYERDAIRPNVLGKFRDLLEATAKSPAMLFYLDNWQSVGPNSPAARRSRGKNRRGLNENYGRELMELHTLGVDGGYTQQDVIAVARCFTGWTISQPQRGGKFIFNPRVHDEGEKIVLGVKIPAGGGMKDGEKVLDILAHSPATAHHISFELAQRFVADNPPESLVDRMAKTFLKSDGDLREVMKTMLKSKEFWSQGAYRSKLKSPLEMVASAVRSVNGDVDYAFGLVNQVAQLGEPLYRKQEPTGYSNSGKEWLNAGGLLARMNFALQLTSNHIQGVKVESAKAARPDGPVAGIALGSPAFQRY
ncbi:MAG TPA: DUF1800 domain-containing protein [Bryobacteraceae bacterium]|nr:DUF1800 domain-containing protein [Bryobacteraceae bacterium]